MEDLERRRMEEEVRRDKEWMMWRGQRASEQAEVEPSSLVALVLALPRELELQLL